MEDLVSNVLASGRYVGIQHRSNSHGFNLKSTFYIWFEMGAVCEVE